MPAGFWLWDWACSSLPVCVVGVEVCSCALIIFPAALCSSPVTKRLTEKPGVGRGLDFRRALMFEACQETLRKAEGHRWRVLMCNPERQIFFLSAAVVQMHCCETRKAYVRAVVPQPLGESSLLVMAILWFVMSVPYLSTSVVPNLIFYLVSMLYCWHSYRLSNISNSQGPGVKTPDHRHTELSSFDFNSTFECVTAPDSP